MVQSYHRDFTILCRSGVCRNIGDSGYVFFLDLRPQAQQLKTAFVSADIAHRSFPSLVRC